MKVQVIKFGELYGVRRKWFHCGELFDIKSPTKFQWGRKHWVEWCLTPNIEEAQKVARLISSKIEVVEEYPQ